MTREIKFRAWDKYYKRMLENVCPLPQADGNFILVAPNGYNILDQRDYVANVETEFCFLDVKIMQYTGLKDKNGEKIFEGDIVCLGSDFDTVVFNCGMFILERMTECYCRSVPLAEYHHDITIEGNIYENPELLNK
jgi:uncharacterized phage protein (TIGR01671 family)